MYVCECVYMCAYAGECVRVNYVCMNIEMFLYLFYNLSGIFFYIYVCKYLKLTLMFCLRSYLYTYVCPGTYTQ